MNSDKYIDVLEHRVMPQLQKHYPAGDGLQQQDLAPCHTSKKVKQFMVDNGINVLPWPGNSPNLNPIENLWSIVKTRLRNHDCTQKTKLIEAIISIWFRDPEVKQMCQTLIYSMTRRVSMLLKAKGGHIKY